MQPLPVELWLKILDFTFHSCEPADIPLYFPFIRSARAYRRERELGAQDKAMLCVLGLVCRSWREMCLSFGSRRVHIRLGDSGSGTQPKWHPLDCDIPSVSTVLLQLSPPIGGLDPVQYAQLVESTVAKTPGVRFLKINIARPNDNGTTARRHFLPVIQPALSALSKLSSLVIPTDLSLDIENVLPALAEIPQLRAFRAILAVRKLPTINPPLLPRLEVLSICICILISEGEIQALEKWLGRCRMPCLVQLSNIGSWTKRDWSWILGLLEHNGTHLKALNLQYHFQLGVFSRRLWQVCPELDTLIGTHILSNTLDIPPEHTPLRTLIHTCDLMERSNAGVLLLWDYAKHAKVNLRPLDGGPRGEIRWSENTWEGIYITNPPVVAAVLRSLVETCEFLGYGALDADGVDARDFLHKVIPSCGSSCVPARLA